jgi:hypothetical protein
MKKLILVLTGIFAFVIINAQSLEDIITKYTAANKLDQISKLKTIKLTGNMSMMGMEMSMEIWMKNPDKIKTVSIMNGMETVQVYDGVKGYMINPMTGSVDPVEMTQEQIKETLRGNMFQNYMATYLKNGQLKLAGEEKVNDKPAYKLKASIEGGVNVDLYIDKGTYLLVKISTTSQGMSMDSYPSDYTENNGVFLPMKTTTSAKGMEFTLQFTKVEVDIPMDDSIFKVKK